MKHINLGTLEVSRIGLGTMGIIYGSVVNVRYPAWGRLLELGINQAAASYRVTQSSNRGIESDIQTARRLQDSHVPRRV
jgi:hypothetical protein